MKRRGFQHEALVYDGPADYLAGTIPYLQEGLEAGERLLVAVGPEQAELLRAELGTDAEWIQFADMREVGRNPASIIPLWLDFVDGSGGAPVRGIGEPVWAARSAAALLECQLHESLLNFTFDRGPGWSLLCPYDAGTLGEEIFALVGYSHPCLNRHGHREPSPRFEPIHDPFAGSLPPPQEPPETLSFDVTGLGEVRRRVADAAGAAGMSAGEVADLVTATSELAANSVVHGGGSGTLRLWSEDERLLVEIEDRGLIEEPLVGRIRPDVNQEGGRGLWLANQLCDLVQIRSGASGTSVRLHHLEPQAVFV
jgi:anti-sigma regulatory factor (Ser/Thr protein kinase)